MTESPPKASIILLAAADAAVTWWREKKPRGWSIAKHVENPAVNCTSYREKRLAHAAARWYVITHPQSQELT